MDQEIEARKTPLLNKSIIVSAVIGGMIVVGGIIGYTEIRRAAEKMAADKATREAADQQLHEAKRRQTILLMEMALRDEDAAAYAKHLEEARLLSAAEGSPETAAQRWTADKAHFVQTAQQRYEQSNPDLVAKRARRDRDERIRQYEQKQKAATGPVRDY